MQTITATTTTDTPQTWLASSYRDEDVSVELHIDAGSPVYRAVVMSADGERFDTTIDRVYMPCDAMAQVLRGWLDGKPNETSAA